MKIYTKGGDKGMTSLLGGKRVSKSDIRLHAYGTVDELNSYLGLLSDQPVNQQRIELLREIQNKLFCIGSRLATHDPKDLDKLPELTEKDVALLERSIDEMERQLPALRSFLLPGGHASVSNGHIARCVCRRAERFVAELAQVATVETIILQYLNRLADLLFVLSRKMGQELDIGEIPWNPKV